MNLTANLLDKIFPCRRELKKLRQDYEQQKLKMCDYLTSDKVMLNELEKVIILKALTFPAFKVDTEQPQRKYLYRQAYKALRDKIKFSLEGKE